VELLELLLREIRDEAGKLLVVAVELSVQRNTGILAAAGELAANGGDLFITAAFVMRDQLFIVLGLALQVAIGRLGTDSHRALETLKGESAALKRSSGSTCTMRCDGSGDDACISDGITLRIERHRMALLLIDRELEIGDGTSGGHAWMVVLRFYFFSLPISVANFSFNFFER
jgi:hypothetical protein